MEGAWLQELREHGPPLKRRAQLDLEGCWASWKVFLAAFELVLDVSCQGVATLGLLSPAEQLEGQLKKNITGETALLIIIMLTNQNHHHHLGQGDELAFSSFL